MTTLARTSGAGGPATGRAAPSPSGERRALVTRLHEECDRQVPFSSTKQLLKEAATAIERLETELARVTSERAEWHATGPTP